MFSIRYRMITISIIIGIFFIVGSLSKGIAGFKKPDVLAYNKDNLIRLHVIANSDTVVDQAIKLKVRNRIIKATESLLLNVQDPDQAEAILKNRLYEFEKVAADELECQCSIWDLSLSGAGISLRNSSCWRI